MKTSEIEYYVADYFNWRQNIIVPNVAWGMFMHECDLLILSKHGYATEVEIKISKSDLKKDLLKGHGHNDDRIKFLYFAIPEKLLLCKNLIPPRAGILIVRSEGIRVEKIKEPIPIVKSNYQFTPEERLNLARLGTMRIWRLKKELMEGRESCRTK